MVVVAFPCSGGGAAWRRPAAFAELLSARLHSHARSCARGALWPACRRSLDQPTRRRGGGQDRVERNSSPVVKCIRFCVFFGQLARLSGVSTVSAARALSCAEFGSDVVACVPQLHASHSTFREASFARSSLSCVHVRHCGTRHCGMYPYYLMSKSSTRGESG